MNIKVKNHSFYLNANLESPLKEQLILFTHLHVVHDFLSALEYNISNLAQRFS